MRTHVTYPLGSLVVCLFAVFSTVARAQQDPMYTMYMWNMMTVNPAYAGSADVMNATVLARRQWVGMDGAPVTNSLMVHSPLKLPSIGLGLSVIDDRIGPSRTTNINGDFAYRIQIDEKSRLAFGLKAGMTTVRMNMSEIPGTDTSDPVFQGTINGGFRPNFGFGVYYWSSSGYIGLAAPKLLADQFTAETEDGSVNALKEERHGFLIAGYVFPLTPEIKFRPSFLLKAVEGAPISADLSANFLFIEKVWIGAAYRTANEISTIISYQLTEQLRAGYAYEMSLSPLRSMQGGSHEVMLSYDLSFTKRRLRSPRYF